MDGAAGSKGRRLATSRRKHLASAGEIPEQERHDIFVRAHTSARPKNSSDKRWSPKWPDHCLIFDTETTLDPAQKLNFGAFRRCKLVGSRYVCVEEGVFHRDDVSAPQLALLRKYKTHSPTLAAVEYFPAETRLSLHSRASFVRSLFWKAVRGGELTVGFNLPFDLSRLAVRSTEGKKGGWSLAFSQLWKNPKTGRVAPNPKRPRIVVDAQNSKMAFMRLGAFSTRKSGRKKDGFSIFARWCGRCATCRTTSWVRARRLTLRGKLITSLPEGSLRKRSSTVAVMSPHLTAC